jgi:hypothetical protein
MREGVLLDVFEKGQATQEQVMEAAVGVVL